MKGLTDKALEYLADTCDSPLYKVKEKSNTANVPGNGGASINVTPDSISGYTAVANAYIKQNHGVQIVPTSSDGVGKCYFRNLSSGAMSTTATYGILYIKNIVGGYYLTSTHSLLRGWQHERLDRQSYELYRREVRVPIGKLNRYDIKLCEHSSVLWCEYLRKRIRQRNKGRVAAYWRCRVLYNWRQFRKRCNEQNIHIRTIDRICNRFSWCEKRFINSIIVDSQRRRALGQGRLNIPERGCAA